MRKIILFVLCFMSSVNLGNNVFASSSSKNEVFDCMKKGFGFMVKTRDESVLNPETIQKRRRTENLIIRTYNSGRRDMLMQAYNEEVEGFKNEIKKDKEGRTHLYQDCLRELSRIRILMMSSCNQ